LREFEEGGKLEFAFGTYGSLWREVWWRFECLLGLKFDLEVCMNLGRIPSFSFFKCSRYIFSRQHRVQFEEEIIITKLKDFFNWGCSQTTSFGVPQRNFKYRSLWTTPYSNVFNTSFRKHLVVKFKI
jgi:hypothetical protein